MPVSPQRLAERGKATAIIIAADMVAAIPTPIGFNTFIISPSCSIGPLKHDHMIDSRPAKRVFMLRLTKRLHTIIRVIDWVRIHISIPTRQETASVGESENQLVDQNRDLELI